MSTEPIGARSLLKLGEDVILDPAGYELRRRGHALKLERIPMELLLFLVQERGRLVSRDEIVERIWGKGISLDTDNSINGAIRKIRYVLRDDPDRPRVIQTVTGKGYRFIAPVAEIQEAPEAAPPPFKADPQPEPAASPAPAPQPSPPADPIPAVASRSTKPLILAIVLGAAAVVLAAAAVFLAGQRRRAQTATPAGRLMLAVLPFQNLTGDPAQDYLSDGMTEEIIAQLGRTEPDRLGVIARTSVMSYKGTRKRLDEIGRELAVQLVLEGTVRRDADRLRVSAQLIQVKDQTHLWARQYDREPTAVLSLQSEIAQEVVDEIGRTLGDRPSKPARSAASSPATNAAYDLYLRAQYFWNKRTIEGLRQAIDYCEQAVRVDPTYAPAHAGMAMSYALLGGYSGESQAEFMSKARAAAVRSLELDPHLPEAHTALALVVQNYDWDWQTAENEFKSALDLNPNYATAHHWYAEHLAFRGRFDEARAEAERARRLDPLSLALGVDTALIDYYSRRYDRAAAKLEAVLAMDPEFPRAHLVRNAYVAMGRFDDALADIEADHAGAGGLWNASCLAHVYGRAGRSADARRQLALLLERVEPGRTDAGIVFWAYAGTGDQEKALSWLEKAYAQHSNALMTLKVEPAYDPLRGEPRFQDVLRRVHLAG
jgi:TolB-like protein/DNA-binding winged helix-turn-helix (wHTH) protein